MFSATTISQRLYILLSILAALTPPIGFFLVLRAQNTLLDTILKECQGENLAIFRLFFDKAFDESYLAFWQYLLPFLPAVIIAVARWVVGCPRPLFAFSHSWIYLIAKGFLVFMGVLVSMNGIHNAAAAVNPFYQLNMKPFFTQSYLALAVVAAPLILSILFERFRAEASYRIVRWSSLFVIVAPFFDVAIFLFRAATHG